MSWNYKWRRHLGICLNCYYPNSTCNRQLNNGLDGIFPTTEAGPLSFDPGVGGGDLQRQGQRWSGLSSCETGVSSHEEVSEPGHVGHAVAEWDLIPKRQGIGMNRIVRVCSRSLFLNLNEWSLNRKETVGDICFQQWLGLKFEQFMFLE